ncbi:NAD(P)/FAD-dependent oxidoreductase [Clostridium paraputrificum]|uniref:NAD(P)/FAD-dependent oxidoreductase n=1 Tax=Clostridium TaxID=1485 RepID=UPI003D33DBAF
MKLIGGNPLWHNINAIKQKYNPLKDNTSCDILIIGGGITGAICAYFLSQLGIKCILLEENTVGMSSTSICTSILQYEIDLDIIDLSKKIGENNARRAFVLCKEALYTIAEIIKIHNIDCSYLEVPSLYYSHNDKDYMSMKREFNLRSDCRFNVDFLDKDACDNYCPFPISSGILSHSGSAVLDPYLFTVNLLKLCHTKGVKIFEKTKVKYTINLDNGIVCTTTNDLNITCKKLLICTGYNAASLFKEHLANFTRTFNIVTSPIDSGTELWYKNMIMKDNTDYHTYIRTTDDSRIIIGGEDISDLGYDEHKNKNAYNKLESKLKKLLPSLGEYTIDYKFNGIFADTSDSLPYVGEHPDFKDHYFCLSYGSNGILYSVLGAQIIGKLYNGDEIPDLDLFKFRR